jgi:uncharacterized membrane protein YGL010W
MRNVTELLESYARYHRDRRNIATHLLGVPLIVFAVSVLLSGVRWQVNGQVMMTGAWLVLLLLSLWWLSRHLVLGLVTTLWVAALMLPAQVLATASLSSWLAWGLGMFVLGWLIQFVGHYYEGRKPAFVDDVTGLVIAPLFITAEVLFPLGWNKALHQVIEAEAGPTYLRDLAHPKA